MRAVPPSWESLRSSTRESNSAIFVQGHRWRIRYTVYSNELPTGTASKFKVISHVEQLALSMCSRKSNGRLWCGTCHNPHRDPVQPAAFYRSIVPVLPHGSVS